MLFYVKVSTEPEHELSFSVLHVKDRHASIESTVDFTASHVKWRVSSLSPVGVIIPSSQQGTHHGAVLVYKEGNHKYFSGSEIQVTKKNGQRLSNRTRVPVC